MIVLFAPPSGTDSAAGTITSMPGFKSYATCMQAAKKARHDLAAPGLGVITECRAGL